MNFFLPSRLSIHSFLNQFQFKIICSCFFSCCSFMSRFISEPGKEPAKNYDKLTVGPERKEIFKLLSGEKKSYESKSVFFSSPSHWSVHTQGISFQVLILPRLLRRTNGEMRRGEKKTTSEIRKQIKYFINYLYFHNMII